jgi:hypothetical protein
MSLLARTIRTVNESRHTLSQISTRINIPNLEKQAIDLRASSEGWSKSAISGQKLLAKIENQIHEYTSLEETLKDSNEMLDMAKVEKDLELVEVGHK